MRNSAAERGQPAFVITCLLPMPFALAAAWIQNRYNLISLPSELYFISYLPIEIHPPDFLVAGAVTIIICFLAALYPAQRAAEQSVVDILRQ